jgi:hypothetical protein
MYRLRTQNIYTELNRFNSKVFIDKNKYPFPPEQANTVFFMDNFLIENIETKSYLESPPISETENDISHVSFKKDGDLIVQVLQVPPDLSAGTQYVSARYGDLLVFNIPSTTLIMRPLHSTMEWISRSFSLSTRTTCFMRPITPNERKMGDEIQYSDTFSIHSSVSILGIDESSRIERLYYNSHEKAKDNGKDVTFRFIPKMKGWYCNNNSQCTEIPLEKMVVNDKGIGTYDGLTIGRNPGCWGVCKYKVKGQLHLKPLEEYKEGGKVSHIVWYTILPVILFLAIVWVVKK